MGVEPWDGAGTRVEVVLRGELAELAGRDPKLFSWAGEADSLSVGECYKGRSSPWWYDAGSFWELLQAAGRQSVERVIETLDGCSGRQKVKAVAEESAGHRADEVTRDQAAAMLQRARSLAKPVRPERLGSVGRRPDYDGYAVRHRTIDGDGLEIPFVVEAWANRSSDSPVLTLCVNRTPVVTRVAAFRHEQTDYVVRGAGLNFRMKAGRKDKGDFDIVVNVL